MAFLPSRIPTVGTSSGNVPSLPIPMASMNQTELTAWAAANPGPKGDKGDTGSTGPSNMPTMTANTTSSISFNSSGLNETVYNTSASLLVTATITLPTSSAAGQIIRYTSNGAIGTLTVTGTVDVGSALTALAANTAVAWQATGTNGHWVRI